MDETKKLQRSKTNRVISGICGGMGEYFNIDPIFFRILFVIFLFAGGASVLLYIILIFVIPGEGGKNSIESGKEEIKDLADKAKQEAEKINIQTKNSGFVTTTRIVIGLMVVLIGLTMLFRQLFPMPWFRWDLFWGLAIIAVGLIIVVKK